MQAPVEMKDPIFTELEPEECMSLLAAVSVGRVGLSVGALPVVLPVNFKVVDGAIVFRTAEGTKLHAASSGRVLAFEADSYGPSGRWGWSVLVQGVATVVTDASEIADLSAAGIDAWGLVGSEDRFVRLGTRMITGRRFGR